MGSGVTVAARRVLFIFGDVHLKCRKSFLEARSSGKSWTHGSETMEAFSGSGILEGLSRAGSVGGISTQTSVSGADAHANVERSQLLDWVHNTPPPVMPTGHQST